MLTDRRCIRCAEKGFACHYIPATTRHIKITCEACRKASQKCACKWGLEGL